ncbi:MAG: hypothetical protein GY830_01005 [Bacteroidetes bacterium]|nr:hypothetical protein [Bacteroidota bacterium]
MPENEIIWRSCYLSVLDKEDLNYKSISKGLNIAVKCPNSECKSEGRTFWIHYAKQGIVELGGVFKSDKFECPFCQKEYKYYDYKNHKKRYQGFGLYNCTYSYKYLDNGIKEILDLETQKNKITIFTSPKGTNFFVIYIV